MAEYTEKVNFQVGFEDKDAMSAIDKISKAADKLDIKLENMGNRVSLKKLKSEAGKLGQNVVDAITKLEDAVDGLGDTSTIEDVNSAFKEAYATMVKSRDALKSMKNIDGLSEQIESQLSVFDDAKERIVALRNEATELSASMGDFDTSDFTDISSSAKTFDEKLVDINATFDDVIARAAKFKNTLYSANKSSGVSGMQEELKSLTNDLQAVSSAAGDALGATDDSELNKRLSEMLEKLRAEEQRVINLTSKYIQVSRSSFSDFQEKQPEKAVEPGKKSAAASAKYFVETEKASAAARKAQEAEKARIAQLEAQEAAEKRAAVAQQRLTEAFDAYIQKAGVSPFNKILGEVENLEYSFVGLKQKYEQMFKSGDFSGLREANNELKEMRASAASAQQQLQSRGFAGIDTSGLQQRLSTLQWGISGLAKSSSKELAAKIGVGFKDATDKLWTFGKKAVSSIYSYSKKLVSAWGNVLSSVFGKVISGWKSALGSVFSSGRGSSNTLLSQIFGIASVAGLVSIGKQAIDTASDLLELDNVISVTFKESADDINDFADNVASRFGLTSNAAKEMAGSFGAILGASNITGEAQREMSKNLVALSGDLASFYNRSTDDMATKLQSALVGNADAVRELGVIMTETNLKAYALQSGITQDYDSLNEATKATLRYNYVLNQMKNAQGDFAATSYSWANQVRTLSNNFKQLLSILGGGIIKALYTALTILNQIVSAAINAANALARIFHFQPVDIKTLLGGGDSGSSGVQDFASDLGNVADGMDNVADSTAKANENLQSFDKLNNITTQTDSGSSKGGSGASGAGGAGGGSLIDFDSYYENVDDLSEKPLNKKLKKILDTLKKFARDIASVDYSKFLKSWHKMTKSFEPLIEDLGKGIIWLWDNVLFQFYRWSVTAGAPAVFELIAAGAEALHEIILAVSPSIDSFWKTTLAPFFSDLGDSFVAKVNGWTQALKNWTAELQAAPNKMEFLKNTFADLKQKLYDWIDDEGITDRLDSIGEHVVSIVKKIFGEDTRAQAESLLGTFTQLNLIVFDNILGLIDRLLGNKDISDFVGFIVDQFGDLADFTFDKLADIIEKIASSDKAKEIIVNIKDAIENIIQWVDDHTDQILTFLASASSAAEFLSEHLTGVLTVVGLIGAAKGIFTLAKTTYNTIGIAKNLYSALNGFGALVGPAGGIGLVIAGVATLGKVAYDNTKETKGYLDEWNDALYDTEANAQKIIAGKSDLWTFQDPHMYTIAINNVNSALNNMSKKTRDAIASNGKYHTSVKEARKAANLWADAMEKSGYANKEQIETLRELANKTGVTSAEITSYIHDMGVNVLKETDAAASITDEQWETATQNWKNSVTGAADWATSGGAEVTGNLSNGMKDGWMSDEEFAQMIGYPVESATNTLNSELYTYGTTSGASFMDGMTLAVAERQTGLEETFGYIATAMHTSADDIRVKLAETAGLSMDEFNAGIADGYIDTKAILQLGNLAFDENFEELIKNSGIAGVDYTDKFCNGAAEEFESGAEIIKAAQKRKLDDAEYAAKTGYHASGQTVAKEYNTAASDDIKKDTTVESSAKKQAEDVGKAAQPKFKSEGNKSAGQFVTGFTSNLRNNPGIKNSLTGKCTEAVNAAKEKFYPAGVSSASDFIRGITTGISNGVQAVINATSNMMNAFTGYDTINYNNGYSIGDNIMKGILNGIRDGEYQLYSKISKLCKDLCDTFNLTLEIHSPSRVFKRAAQWIPRGIAEGIDSGSDTAIDSIDDLASNMTSAFDDTSFDMSDLIDMTKFSSLLSNAENDFNEFLSNVDNKSANVKFTTSSKSFGSIPSIRRNELAAIASQSSSTRAVTEGISALYAQASKTASSTNKMVHVTMELKGKPLADFVIDTVRGDAIQTGKY